MIGRQVTDRARAGVVIAFILLIQEENPMKHPVSAIFLLIALLLPAAPVQAADEIVEKTYCTQGIAYDSIDDLKLDLLNNAKKAVIDELFGEFIVASTAVENFVVTKDQIQTSSLGFVRVEGNTKFHNGEDFADVCVTIAGYVTAADRAKFDPEPLDNKYCDADDDMTTAQLIAYVKDEAIIQALIEHEPKLKGADKDSLLQLVQRVEYLESGFISDTQTYCATFEGEVVPVEVMAFLETQLVQELVEGTASTYDDEFDGPKLNPNWYWLKEDPSRWNLDSTPGKLRIIGTGGELKSQCETYQNILLQEAPMGDFDLETHIFIHPTQNYQQGGLLVFDNPDNYVKFYVIWNDLFLQDGFSFGQGIALISEQNGIYSDWESRPKASIPVTKEGIFLKLSKKNNGYYGFYSSDGNIWNDLGLIIAPAIKASKIGVLATTGEGSNCENNAPEIPVDFDFFRVNETFIEEIEEVDNRQSSLTANTNCNLEGTVRSQPGTAKTTISISNLSSTHLELFWLNYDGQRVSYGKIAPGQTKTQSSYTTHPWVIIRDSDKVCLQLITDVTTMPNVTIRD